MMDAAGIKGIHAKTQVQAARLSIRQAEAKKQQAAGKQWVKTPVAGLVADIRLVEVGVAGVTLEVVLEQLTNPRYVEPL